jgi:predicted transcriptional regulator of viral defense system
MNTKSYQTYGGSGLKVLQNLFAAGHYVFSFDEARKSAELLGIPISTIPNALASMVASNWIQRLRRGLYVGTAELPGFAQAPSLAIGTQLVKPSAISHWSALSFHHLTEQIPHDVFVTTTKKVVTPSMRKPQSSPDRKEHAWNVAGVAYRYTTVKARFFFGFELVWLDERFRVPIFTKERALFDMFAAPSSFGGITQSLEVLESNLRQLQVLKLVEVALQYGVVSAAKRLGWSLQAMGVPERTIAPLRKMPITGFVLLDPGSSLRGPYDQEWNLQLNLPGKAK